MCRSSCFWSGSNSDRNTIHGEERPSAAWKSSVSRIPPNYAIRQSAKPRNPPVVHHTHTQQRGAPGQLGEQQRNKLMLGLEATNQIVCSMGLHELFKNLPGDEFQYV